MRTYLEWRVGLYAWSMQCEHFKSQPFHATLRLGTPKVVLLHLKTFPAIDDMSLKHAAYLKTGHAYGLITESSDSTVVVRRRNESPIWRVFFFAPLLF